MASNMKMSIWDSIKSNPKVLFIAFFASYDFLLDTASFIANDRTGSVVSNMGISKVFWDSLW